MHVIAGLNIAHGGPSYTVPRLCRALTTAGAQTQMLSVGVGDERSIAIDNDAGRCFAVDWIRVPIVRDLRWSSGLSRALRELAPQVDVIHDHGLWLMPNVYAGRVALRAGKPFIVSPRGMLSPVALAFSRFKKAVVWALIQGDVVRRATCIHATSEQEYDEIRSFGLSNPVAIVPNGVDLPEPKLRTIVDMPADRTVLSLGRIHPKKGLDRLVRAWARVEARYPEWRLRIVGPDELGHARELILLAAELKARRVSVEKPVSGHAKVAIYQRADLFVLPTLNENFAVTVAEALASGTPAIVTKGAPWHNLMREGCGWWIDHGVEPLAETLVKAMTMGREALEDMGAKGRAWMARDFSWDRVARDMLDVYHWLVSGGDAPNTVRLK